MKQSFVRFLVLAAIIGGAIGAPSIYEDNNELLPPIVLDAEDRIELPPSSGNITELRYLLWTRSNPGDDDYFVVDSSNIGSITDSNFDGTLPLFVIHPGWTASGTDGWVRDGKTNYLTMMDCNVISVDWNLVVPGPNYFDDEQTMYEVATLNAQFLDWLLAETALTIDRIEITGHSLGAHSAGMTSRYMNSEGMISRITGLDPAGPLFYNKDTDNRLDKSDAVFVDIIHSNGCPAYDICLGLGQAIGHVDFYPNGGRHQPLCVLNANSTGPNLADISGCSHSRAHAYWTESMAYSIDPVANLGFLSWPCDDWNTFEAGGCASCGDGCIYMGYDADRSAEGIYFLSTHGRHPFAFGDDQGIN